MREVMGPGGTIYLIDPYAARWSAERFVARRLVGSVPRGRAVWIKEFSHVPATRWSASIDFVFIDGDHDYHAVARDWRLWTPHVPPHGHVALHDARAEAHWTGSDWGPVELLRELRHDSEWEVVDEADSLAILRRGGGAAS